MINSLSSKKNKKGGSRQTGKPGTIGLEGERKSLNQTMTMTPKQVRTSLLEERRGTTTTKSVASCRQLISHQKRSI